MSSYVEVRPIISLVALLTAVKDNHPRAPALAPEARPHWELVIRGPGPRPPEALSCTDRHTRPLTTALCLQRNLRWFRSLIAALDCFSLSIIASGAVGEASLLLDPINVRCRDTDPRGQQQAYISHAERSTIHREPLKAIESGESQELGTCKEFASRNEAVTALTAVVTESGLTVESQRLSIREPLATSLCICRIASDLATRRVYTCCQSISRTRPPPRTRTTHSHSSSLQSAVNSPNTIRSCLRHSRSGPTMPEGARNKAWRN